MKAQLAICIGLTAAMVTPAANAAGARLRQSGTVTIDQGQAGFIVTAGYGGGILRFKGKSYPFKIGGLGVGGIGVSTIKAAGFVYDLASVSDFYGNYASARAGAVVGNRSVGKMWFRSGKGVSMELHAARKGLMLSAGVDGVVVEPK